MKKTEVQFRKTSVVPLGPQKKHQEREKRQQAEDLVRTLSLPGKHEPEIPLQINTEEKEETRRVASNERGSALGRLSGAVGGMLRGGRPVGARLRPCPHVGRGAPRRALLRRSPAWSRAGMLSVLGHVHLSG